MTPQKLWVLKAHTKTDKIDDVCQNIRQDFDIYRNIDIENHFTLTAFKQKKNTSGHKVWYAFTLYIDNDASANQNALTYEHGKNISR